MKKLLFVALIATVLASCAFYFGPGSGESAEGEVSLAATVDGGTVSSDDANDIDPFMYYADDGTAYLFFASDRGGNYDIYYAKKNGELFEKPVRITNTNINSTNNETSPMIFTNFMGTHLAFTRISPDNSSTTVTVFRLDDFVDEVSYINDIGSYADLGTYYYYNPSDETLMLSHLLSFPSTNADFDSFSLGDIADAQTNDLPNLNDSVLDATAVYWEEPSSAVPGLSYDSITFYLFETMNSGYHQISLGYGQAITELDSLPDLTNSGTTNVDVYQTYGQAYNDISPFVDMRDNSKLYFASDRYEGSGSNYDLYRYNTETIFNEVIQVYINGGFQ